MALDAGGHRITFSGNNLTRIFSVTPVTALRLTNIALINGHATNTGEAILNQGVMFAEQCRFFSNVVVGANGVNGTNGLAGTNSANTELITPGTPGSPGSAGQEALGGAVFNAGDLTLRHCYFGTNAALGGMGGQGGDGGAGGAHIPRDIFYYGSGGAGGTGGVGESARGGAVANAGTFQMESCTFSNTLAKNGDGGRGGAGGSSGSSSPNPPQAPAGVGGTGGTAQGGTIFNTGSMMLSNTLLVGSTARGGSGGDDRTFLYVPGGHGGAAEGGAIYNASNSLLVNATFFANTARGGTRRDSACNCSPVNGAMRRAGRWRTPVIFAPSILRWRAAVRSPVWVPVWLAALPSVAPTAAASAARSRI